MRLQDTTSSVDMLAPQAARIRWAGLAGREHGDAKATDTPFVLLHGLTFDRHMWDPVLEALPDGRRAIAFDLPGHGGSPALGRDGLEAVVDAVHEAVLAAGLEAPIMVGHSIGGPLASIYAATYPAAGVVSIDAPLRVEPFAELLRSLRPQLTGTGFGQVWGSFQASFRLELLTAAQRELVQSGLQASQRLVLGYQADVLERPLDEVVRWRDEGLSDLRRRRVPYLTLHANPVDPAERAFLADRLPHAEIVVWPVGHHFPHLSDPDHFAALLTRFAAGMANGASALSNPRRPSGSRP